jgi:hypothetical protein
VSVIEFQTYIITALSNCRRNTTTASRDARIIILTDDGEDEEDMVEFLLEHPYQVTTFTPLTRDEIYRSMLLA